MLGRGCHEPRGHRGVQRQDLVLLRLLEEQLLHFLELGGIGGGHVVRLRPVLAQVVKLPGHVVERILVDRAGDVPGRADDFRAGDPAFVIDGVVAHHLEILRLVLRGRVGVGLVEGVGEAHAFDRASA